MNISQYHFSTIIIFSYFTISTLNYIFFQYPTFIRSNRNFIHRRLQIEEVCNSIKPTNIKFTIQIMTIGNEMKIISEGLIILIDIFNKLPQELTNRISVDLVSENARDKILLDKLKLNYNVSFHLVPKIYETRNDTKLKARSLQYMIAKRKVKMDNIPLDKLFIIHFDAESVISLQGLLSIIYSVTQAKPEKTIFQGPIFYPRFWLNASLLSRQMESLRPWNCYDCKKNTGSSTPYHLHGSNLVIRGDVELNIGWDFGNLYGYPLIAEDLLFGLKSYLKLGKDAFGWHGAILREQPAFTLFDSIKQRIRWVRGTLQALTLLPTWSEFRNLENKSQQRIKLKIRIKILIYAFGFFPALISVLLIGSMLLYLLYYSYLNIVSPQNNTPSFSENQFFPMMPIPDWIVYFSLFGALLWLLSFQIGLHHNLKDSNLSIFQQIKEHILILIITPIAAVFDTGTAFFTTLFWMLGYKGVTWDVTPKAYNN